MKLIVECDACNATFKLTSLWEDDNVVPICCPYCGEDLDEYQWELDEANADY